MSGQAVNRIVSQFAHISAFELPQFEAAVGATFKQTEENPYWTFYEFELSDGPFARGDFRLSKAGGQALLSLWAREEPALVEADLDLRPWGEVRNIDVNPRIQPEGTYAYIYDVSGLKVSFQFTYNSKRLRSVALEWGKPE